MEAGAGLVIALSMLPVRRGLSSALLRVQYGERYPDREKLRALGRDLLTPRRAPDIARLLCERVSAGLGVSPVALLPVHGTSLDASGIDGGIPIPLSELPPEVGSATTRLSRQLFSLSPTVATSRLRRAGFRTLAPLAVSGRLLALFAAGDRAGRGPLSTDDLGLLEEVLAPAALALDHARLYEALEEEARRYKTLKEFHEDVVAGSAAAIAVTDELGRFSSVNPAFCALLGKPETELLFQPASSHLPPDLLAIEGSQRKATVLGGSEAVVDIAVSPFPGSGSKSLSKVLVIHDATEMARLEKTLVERERLAALSSLSAGVAHEVNTPLTGVASFARLVLDDTAQDDPRRPLLEKIEQQAFRASRLISSLLDLARGKPRDVSPLIPLELAREAVRSVDEEARMKKVQIAVEAPQHCRTIAGHGDALIQVLVNLLKNGIEAVGAKRSDQRVGGCVRVGIREESDRVVFEIEDDGPGLPAGLKDRIFEPFTSTKTAQGGVGLGLAIASDIVKAHGGSISAEGRDPRGTRFVVSLPAIS
jgi:signal transduction histidine kinase